MRLTFLQTAEARLLLNMEQGVNDEYVYESFIEPEGDQALAGFRHTRDWADDQFLYFYAEFSQPFTAIAVDEQNNASIDFDASQGKPIMMRIAISAVDVEGAKNNLYAELAEGDFNLDTLAKKAYDLWDAELQRIQVQGPDEADMKVFYTNMYHAMIAPNLFSDADGRYRAHDLKIYHSDRPVYTVFSLWDTFRSLHPLFSLIQRERTVDFINTFINNYETDEEHMLPIWELAGNETHCMIGNHAIPVIADAYFAGIQGFDPEKALEAMVNSSRQDRRGIGAYVKYGFIPVDVEGEAVSKTLEYAYDDWCVARMAEAMGKTDIAKEFYLRAQAYKNLYNPKNQFFQGRRNGGYMQPFDPTQVNFTLTEANTWQYNFFVPQDINTHIDMMGGAEAYGNKLDGLFTASSKLTGREQVDITGLIGQYAHGNEPSHNTVYMYNFIGQPTKTQKYVKQVMDEFYTDERAGLCGNEDCGQMSAWGVFSAMGFYPATPASGYYVLGLPRFDQVTLNFDNGKQFKVKAKDLSPQNCYVKSVKLNGKPLERSYITFDEVYQGGELVFTMTNMPDSPWATQPEQCPVMRIPGESILVVPAINAESNTFFDTLTVTMSHPCSSLREASATNPEGLTDRREVTNQSIIYYTLDGTEPNENSLVYTEPLVLKQTTQIRAAALQEGRWSSVVDANYHLIDAKLAVKLDHPYSNQYEAGGLKALIDHQRGGDNFRTGVWQGYQGVDLVATVDLGAKQKINRLAGSFLQEYGSWIFMPKEVEFFVSDDGKKFRSVGKVANQIPLNEEDAVTQELAVRPRCEARYVKMAAKTIGTCPEGHPGAGQPAWIFCDEFIIE
jgi:predicted alpha-1,2-mannosidase